MPGDGLVQEFLGVMVSLHEFLLREFPPMHMVAWAPAGGSKFRLLELPTLAVCTPAAGSQLLPLVLPALLLLAV